MRNAGIFFWEGVPDLTFYQTFFESVFLETTNSHLLSKVEEWDQNCSCYQYLLEVDAVFTQEIANSDFWLQPSTKEKLLVITIQVLVTDMAKRISEKDGGIVDFFKNMQIDKLQLLYKIYSHDQATYTYILKLMTAYISERGLKIVQNEENLKDPVEFVTKLLALKAEIDRMVLESFSNRAEF